MATMTLEKLALLMKEGFNNLEDAMKNGFNSLTERVQRLEHGQENILNRLDRVEIGQEDILLRLDQKANKIDVDELAKQINKSYPKY